MPGGVSVSVGARVRETRCLPGEYCEALGGGAELGHEIVLDVVLVTHREAVRVGSVVREQHDACVAHTRASDDC